MPMHRTNKSKGGKQATAERIGRMGRCEFWWVHLKIASRRRDALRKAAKKINRRRAKGK